MPALRALEDFYVGRIGMLAACRVVVTPVARGLGERQEQKALAERELGVSVLDCLPPVGSDVGEGTHGAVERDEVDGDAEVLVFVADGHAGRRRQDVKDEKNGGKKDGGEAVGIPGGRGGVIGRPAGWFRVGSRMAARMLGRLSGT